MIGAFIVAYTHRYFGDDGKDITARLPQLQGRIFHTGEEEQDPRAMMSLADILLMLHGGIANPEWIEWLMGFPPKWTDLGYSATP